MKNKENRGGHRLNAGRKKPSSPKKTYAVYLSDTSIKKVNQFMLEHNIPSRSQAINDIIQNFK